MHHKTRVAAYCRVSTEKEEQLLSLETQKQVFTEYAEKEGYELVQLYADEGISGTKLKNRTQFLQMMEDARNSKFDKVIVKDVSRLSRNTLDFLNTLRELKQLNIDCIFLSSNMKASDGELVLTIMAVLAQEESGNLSKRVKFGKRKNAAKGRVPNLAYGYDKTKGDYFSLKINEKEAGIIRYIYSLYLNEGYGANKIAQLLNQKGLKTKRGCNWNQKGVCRILTNPLYTGKVINGKEEVSDFLTSRREKKSEDEWLIADKPDLRIIPDETFVASVELMAERNKAFSLNRVRQSNRFPFSTLIKCKDCGYSFRRIKKKRKDGYYIKWVCSGANGNGRDFCDNRTIIDEAELLEKIREYLLGIIKNKNKFLEDTKAEIRKKYYQDKPFMSEEDILKEVDKLQSLKNKQIEMFETDIISLDELKVKTKGLDQRIKELQSELQCSQSYGSDDRLTKIIGTYCKDIETLLSTETMDNILLKKIIEEIEVSHDGKVEVKLKIKSQI